MRWSSKLRPVSGPFEEASANHRPTVAFSGDAANRGASFCPQTGIPASNFDLDAPSLHRGLFLTMASQSGGCDDAVARDSVCETASATKVPRFEGRTRWQRRFNVALRAKGPTRAAIWKNSLAGDFFWSCRCCSTIAGEAAERWPSTHGRAERGRRSVNFQCRPRLRGSWPVSPDSIHRAPGIEDTAGVERRCASCITLPTPAAARTESTTE